MFVLESLSFLSDDYLSSDANVNFRWPDVSLPDERKRLQRNIDSDLGIEAVGAAIRQGRVLLHQSKIWHSVCTWAASNWKRWSMGAHLLPNLCSSNDGATAISSQT